MKLDKLILVNWGSLQTQEYAMGNMTLLTGPTGSGKSTMLDALQTVMTATYQNVFSYNPGQDESSQSARNGKTKRTLWSYITGAEDNLFARPEGANGYIAAVFKPSEGEEGKCFTALVAASARVDGSGERKSATQERLALLIVDGCELKIEDLTSFNDKGQMVVVRVGDIEAKLKRTYGPVVTNLRDSKREYLSQLYGRFRGQKSVSFPEAEQAARAWSHSIAHKPIGSVDELVKTQILEHDQQQLSQRITQISGLMRQVAVLREDGERLKANISRLEQIAHASDRSLQGYQTALQYQLMSSKRSLRDDEVNEKSANEQIEELQVRIQQEVKRVEALDKDMDAKRESQVKIQARLSGIPAADQKRRIDEQLAQASKGVQDALAALTHSVACSDSLLNTARHIIRQDYPHQLRSLEPAVKRVVATLSSCAERLNKSNPAELVRKLTSSTELDVRVVLELADALDGIDSLYSDLFNALTHPENSFVSALHTQLAALDASVTDASRKEKDAADRKANLAGGGADYPREVQYALGLLREGLRGANPVVLCDLIEPLSAQWQDSIESYMGGARFNFVVDPDWETRAIRFVRERNLRVKVIQGSLCLRHAREKMLAQDSIVQELQTEHPIARAYLVDQFGGVVKVFDDETLRQTPRGVTLDGKASSARTMFSLDKTALVFGKEAKRLALLRAEKEHADAEKLLSLLKTQRKALHELLAPVGKVTLPNFAVVHQLATSARALESARADLARLDLTEVVELEAQAQSLMSEIKALNDQSRKSVQRQGEQRSAIMALEKSLIAIESAREAKRLKVESDLARLKGLCAVNNALSFTLLEKQVDDMLEQGRTSVPEMNGHIHRGLQEAQSYLGDVREFLAEYNSHARSDERFDAHFGLDVRNEDFGPIYAQLVNLSQKVRAQLAVQREVGLVKNLDQLRTAESSFKDVFTKQFCYEIRNAVDIGVKSLRALNGELERLKFGTDRFRIDWSEWVPEFKEYYDFFSAAYELSETQESNDLFGASELSLDNCKVRDRLVELLLSNDQDRALKELQRVADYRNYRRYEIWKESDSGSKVPLSSWGTGSGGQLETPAYIVRAAVVTNRLKHFDKGMNLKMMVNDESFSKMDEARAHDVIKFMRDHLGMQLICAMPTKHAGALKSEFSKEWCFTRTEATANGQVNFISEADERDLNPDKLRELWASRRQEVRQQAQLTFEEKERVSA